MAAHFPSGRPLSLQEQVYLQVKGFHPSAFTGLANGVDPRIAQMQLQFAQFQAALHRLHDPYEHKGEGRGIQLQGRTTPSPANPAANDSRSGSPMSIASGNNSPGPGSAALESNLRAVSPAIAAFHRAHPNMPLLVPDPARFPSPNGERSVGTPNSPARPMSISPYGAGAGAVSPRADMSDGEETSPSSRALARANAVSPATVAAFHENPPINQEQESNSNNKLHKWIQTIHCKAALGSFDQARTLSRQLLERNLSKESFMAAINFERNCGNDNDALIIAKRKLGLQAVSPPFVKVALDISTKLEQDPADIYTLVLERTIIDTRAHILQELAQHKARQKKYQESQALFDQSIPFCLPNLKYEPWLKKAAVAAVAGARSEMEHFCHLALANAHKKHHAELYLTRAMMEEFLGNFSQAEYFYEQARNAKECWRSWFDSILFLLRHSKVDEANRMLQEALRLFPKNGRLGALYFQLNCSKGNEEMLKEKFKRALSLLPNSGEILCEWGRFLNNPHHKCYDPEAAALIFLKAAHCTPQYGDPLIELANVRIQRGEKVDVDRLIAGYAPSHGLLWSIANLHHFDSAKDVMDRAVADVQKYNLKRNDFGTVKQPGVQEKVFIAEAYEHCMSAFGPTYPTFTVSHPAYRRILEENIIRGSEFTML